MGRHRDFARLCVIGLVVQVSACEVEVTTANVDETGVGGAVSIGGAAGSLVIGGSAGLASGGAAGTVAGGQSGAGGTMLDGGKDASADSPTSCPLPWSPTSCPDAIPVGCDSCTGTTCAKECTTGTNACKSITVDCPQGLDCKVDCVANGACEGAIIDCTKAASCSVVCAGDHACKNALIKCGSGPCLLSCAEHDHACGEGTQLECGAASCTIACNGLAPPSVVECSAQPCTGCPSC